ncbi:MAG: hypothetical protein U0174_25600 [Polyangiaceae bacterium]
MQLPAISSASSARFTWSRARVIAFLACLAGCSSGGTTGTSGGGEITDAASTETDASRANDAGDGEPPLMFAASLEGKPVTVTNLEIRRVFNIVRDRPDIVEMTAQLTPDSIPGGSAGTPTLTVHVYLGAVGTGRCANNLRGGPEVSVSVIYVESDIAYSVDAPTPGLPCEMNVTEEATGPYTAGNVKGTAAGKRTFPFDITWRQRTPPAP